MKYSYIFNSIYTIEILNRIKIESITFHSDRHRCSFPINVCLTISRNSKQLGIEFPMIGCKLTNRERCIVDYLHSDYFNELSEACGAAYFSTPVNPVVDNELSPAFYSASLQLIGHMSAD